MPVVIIQLHVVATIVVARPPCFLAEQCVLSHRLRCEQTVLQFPCPLELVEIFCADVLEIFLHDIQQLNAAQVRYAQMLKELSDLEFPGVPGTQY